MKVINLFAGPGAGKSTTASGLFFLMKSEGMSVELVTEYAKDVVWEKRDNLFQDQIYLTAKQNRRLHRLGNQVEYAITDSPLLLGLIYRSDEYYKSYDNFLREVFDSYCNRNFFIQRFKKYVEIGRNQNAQEAKNIDDQVYDMLTAKNIPFVDILGNSAAPQKILDIIKREKDD